jgi:hypothetical protein
MTQLQLHEARVNITWAGQNGDLPDPVSYDATDAQVLAWATEALQAGSVPGIAPDRRADLRDFVVDRFPASAEVPWNRLFVRPKTPFGR